MGIMGNGMTTKQQPPRRNTDTTRTARWLPILMPVVFLAVALLIVLSTTWSAAQRADAVDQRIRRTLLRNAMDMAAAIPLESARALSFTSADRDHPAFIEISNSMKAFSRIMPNRGIYSMRKRGESLLFGPESYDPGDPMASPPGVIYEQPPPAAITIFDDGRPVVFGPYTDEYGSFITALAPVYDPAADAITMVVGFDITTEDWAAQLRAARRPGVWGGSLLLVVLLLGGLVLAVKYRLPPASRHILRYAEIGFLTCFGLAFSLVLGTWSMDYEVREQRMAFEGLADAHAEVVRQTLARIDGKLRTVQRFFEASEFVDAEEFAHFAEAVTAQSALTGLGWIPGPDSLLVDPMAQAVDGDHEQAGSVTGPETTRQLTYHFHPPDRWHVLRDLDHGSDVLLETALARAARVPMYTHATVWPSSLKAEAHARLLLYRTLTVPPGMAARVPRQTGWVWGVLDLQTLLEAAFSELAPLKPMVEVRLYDVDATATITGAATFPPSAAHAPAVGGDKCPLMEVRQYRQALPAFGRVLAFEACPTDTFLATYPIRVGVVIGGAGVILTLFLTVLAGTLQRLQRVTESQRSEAKYRRLFEAMTSGFALHELLYDAQGNPVDYRFLEVNRAFEQQTGLKARDLIGRTLHEVLPDSEPFWLQRYAEVVRTGRSDRFEHYGVELDRHFEVIVYCPAPHHFAVLVNDITFRKRYEEQLARWQHLLELLMQLATRFINLPTDQIDEATRTALEEVACFNRADRAYQFTYDWDKETLSNTHEWCAEGVASTNATMRDVPIAMYPEAAALHRRGEPYFVSDVATMNDDDPGKKVFLEQGIQSLMTIPLMTDTGCIGFIGFETVRAQRNWAGEEISLLTLLAKLLTNAHLRKEAENERQALETKMQQSQKLESLGLLAGGIAHDFNNILTTVLGNADLALQDLSPVSPAREPLGAIETGARRAADLCRQMLAYAGRGRFVIESFSVNELIEEMLHLLKTSISKRALFNVHLEPELPRVKGDISQIRQILLNLVINASEALQEKSGTISLHTGLLDCDQDYLDDVLFDHEIDPGLYVVVEVADTGCGMDKETLVSIFDPFFTTKFTGRGLGLSAVMGIVRGHKGALKVYSEKNKGSIFKLLLPAATDEHETKSTGSVTPATQPMWQGSGTLLLVDDEESIRALASRLLGRMGFDVITANDGEEALVKYEQHRAQLVAIILDLTMPHKSGDEALSDLRKRDTSIPIIIASGYSTDELHDRMAVKGVTAFVQKPYNSKSLRETLSRILSEDAVDEASPPAGG